MFVGPALRLRKGSSPVDADINMQSRGPKPIPEPVTIPDVEMEPTPMSLQIPAEPPAKNLKEWEIQTINRGISVIRKHDGDDSAFRKEEKLLIKQGLKILEANDLDSSFMFQNMGNAKKQKLYENDESYLLHKDKKPNLGERHLMGFPFDFWGIKEETHLGFSEYTQEYTGDTQSTARRPRLPTLTGNTFIISNPPPMMGPRPTGPPTLG